MNLHFRQLDDPLGLCKDVSEIGTRGNGDITVDYTVLEQIPYLMGLIRQSFDYQMDSDLREGL